MLGYIISDEEEINVRYYKILSFDILHKTNLNIFVVENNKVLYKNNINPYASHHGHIQVLEWFKNSGYEFKYNVYTINYAFENRQVHVLEWFINSGYKLKYERSIIIRAIIYGYNEILEFFKQRNLKKVIIWTYHIRHIRHLKYFKTIKYKTKNNYIKGYNKN